MITIKMVKKKKEKKNNTVNWRVLFFSILVVFGIALLGNLFTGNPSSSEWYNSIRPAITPPSWIFPIVWNILFFLIALSLYFSWIKAGKNKKIVAWGFGLNLFLNSIWSFLFFKLQSPLFGFIDIILIIISIVSLMILTWKIDRKSTYLLIPYLLWVSFASIINFLAIR